MGRLIAGSSLNGGSMKITYIHHSAFLAETEHACLLFDYFKGSLPKLPEGKRLYIFASHRHPDHFSKVIFDIAAENGDTVLLLSSDIWRKRVPEELKVEGRHADAAFLPLDPRLGEYFYLGIDDFMKMVDTDWIFPMHFWGEFDVGARLKALDCSRGYRERIVEISRQGQEFSI